MNELQVFNNAEFGDLRVIVKNNEYWFVGKDVATALGYTNPLKAVRDHVDEDDKGMNETFTPAGGKQQTLFINESGLYSLILSSKLPKAKEFKRWVTSEILPSIRKTGTYSMQKTNPLEALQQIGQSINKTIEALVEQDRRMKNIETVTRVQNDRIGDMEKKVQLVYDCGTITHDNWRTHVRPLINQIAKCIPVLDNADRFSAAWQESYRRLEREFNCNLTLRVNNKRERLRLAGATKKVIDKVNNLDIIGEDKRLIECYISILKRMVLEYKRAA